MTFRPVGLRRWVLAATISPFVVPGASGVAVEMGAISSTPIDCGPAALHALLSIEGRSVDFDRVAARLQSRRGGHSMKELAVVGAAFGSRLEGSFVGKDPLAIDRPMIAFIKDDRIRHFVVIRPVGHTGSLVQVIDSNQPPRIIDKTELVASYQWTGLVLVPQKTRWAMIGGLSLVAISGVVGVGRMIARIGRHRRSTMSRI